MSGIHPSAESRKELTIRGLILGVVITVIFTAANVYFGLKAGLTFATSIPAAVIAMALLRRAAGNSIGETNIVQTIASSAGTLSSIIFVLPGLVMIGWWTGFPYWMSTTLCALGGVLGVMYSIPLRRALVTNSPLPYPEGVACAEVLKVGHASDSGEGSRQGLVAIVAGAIVSAGFSIVVATQVFAANIAQYFRLPGGDRNGTGPATGFDLNFSFALLAVGHLVGLWVGIAILVGACIAWLGGVPYLTSGVDGAAEAVALFAWSKQVRFIGAGCIAVAALWTLVKLAKPVASGLMHTLAAARSREEVGSTERDMSPVAIGGLLLACLVAIAALVIHFVHGTTLQSQTVVLLLITLAFVLLGGFIVSAICGYLAGLVGSTNSPISGVGILAILMYAALLGAVINAAQGEPMKALIAFALFTLSITKLRPGTLTVSPAFRCCIAMCTDGDALLLSNSRL